MKTVFKSDASLKNYNEKMEEIGLDCMHACVHQPCQFFLSIEDPNRKVSEGMVTLIRFEIDNVMEKKGIFPSSTRHLVVVQNSACYPILVSVIHYRLKQIPSCSSSNEFLRIC